MLVCASISMVLPLKNLSVLCVGKRKENEDGETMIVCLIMIFVDK